MKKNDKQTLDMLKNEFGKSMGEIRVPERLQKNNIVEMLENSKSDFSDKTGTVIQLDEHRRSKTASNATLRRSLGIAAMLIIVIGCSLLIRMSDEVNIIKTEPTLNNYNAENLFKAAESYEEVEKAVKSILNQPASPSAPDASATQGSDSSSASSAETTAANEGVTNNFTELGPYVIDNSKDTSPSGENGGELTDGITGIQADIVKSDGENLYVVTGGKNTATGKAVDRIQIVRAVPADSMEIISTITLDEAANSATNDECIEIYLQDKTLIAVVGRRTNVATDTVAYTKYQTVALYYDISDPTAVIKTREFVQDGSYVTSSIHGQSLCLVTDDEISDNIKNVVPAYKAGDSEEIRPDAGSIYIATNNPEAARVFMTKMNVSDSAAPISCAVFIGSDGDSLFASGDSFLIERTFVSVNADENGVHDNLTEIYRFDITESGIALVGSYIVEGAICSEPSVDSSTGNLRVVSTGRDGSALYILNKNMELVGWYDKILPQQKIKTVRFIGSTCYIIAADDADTTVIIDMSNPESPQKLETVSAQGFSEEMFSIGENQLIKISLDSSNGVTDGITVSLYDLSDAENLSSVDSYRVLGNFNPATVGDAGSIMLSKDSKTIAIPTVAYDAETGSAVSSYALFSYADGDLVYINSFDHDVNSNGSDATRCACIGDSLYTVSGEKIVAFSISQAQQLAAVELY